MAESGDIDNNHTKRSYASLLINFNYKYLPWIQNTICSKKAGILLGLDMDEVYVTKGTGF